MWVVLKGRGRNKFSAIYYAIFYAISCISSSAEMKNSRQTYCTMYEAQGKLKKRDWNGLNGDKS